MLRRRNFGGDWRHSGIRRQAHGEHRPCPARSLPSRRSPCRGTARGEHAALIRELGATPIDYQREDFTRVLPGGFDVVFDGIGEEGYRRSFAALKRGGPRLRLLGGVQAQRRMLTMLVWIARLYLWKVVA